MPIFLSCRAEASERIVNRRRSKEHDTDAAFAVAEFPRYDLYTHQRIRSLFSRARIPRMHQAAKIDGVVTRRYTIQMIDIMIAIALSHRSP